MNKPVSIIREEFKNDLINLINNSGLQLFIVEPIIQEVFMEVRSAAKTQLELDKKRYEESLMAESSKTDDYIEDPIIETENV
jgi:hypothetical protein